MDAKLLLVQTLSPLHAGTGQGVGVIDLPIAREKATNIPYLPGSSLKGVLRDACDDANTRTKIFGPDTDNPDAHAGAVNFTDARLLLLPVRSLRGVFAWVTSPLLLRRLLRDAEDVQGVSINAQVPSTGDDKTCLIIEEDCAITMSLNGNDQVILEDLSLIAKPSSVVSSWARWLAPALYPEDEEWQQSLSVRLCVVSDDVISFLLETATEITARIRLHEDKKTVERGALWYEETLPTETVLASLVVAASSKRIDTGEVFRTIRNLIISPLQFGGSATIGRGLCKAHLIGENES